jgi:carboxyl-terminal processing protease
MAATLAVGQTQPAGPSSAALPSASQPADNPAKELEHYLKQLVNVFSTVSANSADPTSVDKMIYGGAIPSMLRQLDPHTQFFDPGQFQQLKQMQESEQKGFGSVVSVLPGQVIFLQTLPGTPSNKAGIQAGDELIAINNYAIRTLDPEQIVQLLTEARQQKITAFIRRQGYSRLFQFTLTPELVDAPSVDRAFLLEPGYGYIRVASWDINTAKELHAAIEKLSPDHLKGLVLDLRNNPGGLVKAALDGAAMFLEPGQRILTARGRSKEVDSADVPRNAQPYHFALALIVNEKTASASEILSGALQDHDRATIVGEPTYGKGLVQSVMPLSGGSGLAITTAFYYTPSGRTIQKPLRDSALSETFSEKRATTLPTYKTDKGRTVTGGGGIQPDIVVTPASVTRFESILDNNGLLTAFATKYLSEHSPLPDSFQVSPDLLDELKVELAARGVEPGIAEWIQESRWLKSRLQEEIVTQARGVDKGDEVLAQRDPQVQAALHAVEGN